MSTTMRFIKHSTPIIVLLLFISCRGEISTTRSPRKVKCESITMVNPDTDHSSFAGKVTAASDLNIGFRVAGIIQSASLAEGAFVRKGDIVAQLDKRDYELQLTATQAEYDAIKAEVDRVTALYAEKSVSANDYDKATNGLRAITAKLDAHRNALSDCELRAPMNGYIVKSNFDTGEAVAAGTPIVSMISSSAPLITIDIPATNYLRQEMFAGATATFELFGDTTFPLRLQGVSPKGNINQLYRLTFEVEPNDAGQLPAVGMSAMVRIDYTTTNHEVAEIPFSAIVERDGDNYVWAVVDSCVELRKVSITKPNSNGECIVTSGLTDGDVVVTAGARSLNDGEYVDIMAEASASNIGEIK